MNEAGIFRRRKLPHIDVEGKPYFITGCLAGSLSAAGMKRIKTRRDELDMRPKPIDLSDQDWEIKKHKLAFKLVDTLLDGDTPVRHFDDDNAAEIVQNAFLHFADERYRLLAFVVMPSHHHWLFLPDEHWAAEQLAASSSNHTPREIISHSVQSFTATQCNRVLARSGTFWQGETFDHYARDEAEMLRIIEYIEQNPVAAGLAQRPEDYKWSSARIRFKLGLPQGDPIPKPT